MVRGQVLWLLGRVTMLASGLTACLAPDLVQCEDDTVCPSDKVCVGGQCVLPEAIAACAGRADGELCVIDGLGAGACADGLCVFPLCGDGKVEGAEACDDGNRTDGDGCAATCDSDETCGNGVRDPGEECDDGNATPHDACQTTCQLTRCGEGIVDPGEACDDGNLVAGDGCAPDCASDETCGNGVLDFFAGELCDDGGTSPGDGCDGGCAPETLAWEPHDPVLPPPLVGRGLVYDSARDRVVLFGGVTTDTTFPNQSNRTFELVGDRWREVTTVVRPQARESHGLAYDPRRARVVLFGGRTTGSAYLGDTWEYDGAAWTLQSPTTSPTARASFAMAYDARRQRVVLHGGQLVGNSPTNETWAYDGVTWTQVALALPGPTRSGHAMADDPRPGGGLVLFGGGGALTDTWRFDGTGWTEVSTVGAIPGRSGHAMAFDLAAGAIVVAGGRDASGPRDDVWALDDDAWTPRGSLPQAMTRHSLAYDHRRDRLVAVAETSAWVGDAGGWSSLDAPAPPAPGGSVPRMSYDARRGRVLLVLSEVAGTETWSWDGAAWSQLSIAVPGPGNGGSMVYDAGLDRMVLFGGALADDSTDPTTWVFADDQWVGHLLADTPVDPAAFNIALAYDARRGRVVCFDGVRRETSVLDGLTWTQLAGPGAPPVRWDFAMEYDLGRDRVVLFGGRRTPMQGQSLRSDTWEFDGEAWAQATPIHFPPARAGYALMYDPGRGTTVLVGGDSGARMWGDAWSYDGAEWTELAPAGSLVDRSLHGLEFDATRGGGLLFGGYSLSNAGVARNDTLALTSRSGRPAEACASGRDVDGDGAVGCADDECWPWCAPACSPFAPAEVCAAGSSCGDGTCDPLESCRSCPSDCPLGTPACPARCGDAFCDPADEDAVSCPGDCVP